MDKNNKTDMQDDKLRDIFSGTKIKAGENLKYRIMQQIETEKALSAKKVKTSTPLIGNMLSVFGIMYVLIAITGVGIYLTGGKDTLQSITSFLPVMLIALVCHIFLLISIYDDRRRSKQFFRSR